MTAFSDPLSIATTVITDLLDDYPEYRFAWLEVDIWRLLANSGWLVKVSRVHIRLDKYKREAA